MRDARVLLLLVSSLGSDPVKSLAIHLPDPTSGAGHDCSGQSRLKVFGGIFVLSGVLVWI